MMKKSLTIDDDDEDDVDHDGDDGVDDNDDPIWNVNLFFFLDHADADDVGGNGEWWHFYLFIDQFF